MKQQINYMSNPDISIFRDIETNYASDQVNQINDLSKVIVNIFYIIHKNLGPGLLESIYERAICYELKKLNISFEYQKGVNVFYEGEDLDIGFRADIIVDSKIIIEVKSVESIAPVHFKQLQSYLKCTNLKLGLLVNFNSDLIKDGIRRVVNRL